MAKYDLAEFAAINARAYRLYMARDDRARFTLTRGQLEAICRDLADYTDRDADARGWAEQATKNAAEIARLRSALDIERGRVAGMEEGAARLRATLQWYGDGAAWASSPGQTVHLDGCITTWTTRPIDGDGGRRARAALAEPVEEET